MDSFRISMVREKWDGKFFIRKEQIEDLTRKIREKYRLVYPTLKDGGGCQLFSGAVPKKPDLSKNQKDSLNYQL